MGQVPAHDPPGTMPAEFLGWLEHQRRDLRGPRSELVSAQVDVLVAGVAAHGSLQVAAGLAGVDLKTARKWLDRGHADMERRAVARGLDQDPGPEGEYERLLREVLAAVAWWSGRLLAIVQREAEAGDVKAAQWLLARVGPKIAAPRVEVDELGGMGGRAGEGSGPEDRRADFLARIAEIRGRKAALESGELADDGAAE